MFKKSWRTEQLFDKQLNRTAIMKPCACASTWRYNNTNSNLAIQNLKVSVSYDFKIFYLNLSNLSFH